MNQMTCTVDWISAYLEWTDAGSSAGDQGHFGCGGMEAADAEPAEEEFTAAYLAWLDAAPPAHNCRAQYRARGARDGDVEMNGGNVFREALLVALQTESDCIQFLQQIVEAGGTTTRTLSFASEALQHAERLLEDERGTWRALTARYPWDAKPMSAALRVEMEMVWPHAMENVAADVHALRGTILALQATN